MVELVVGIYRGVKRWFYKAVDGQWRMIKFTNEEECYFGLRFCRLSQGYPVEMKIKKDSKGAFIIDRTFDDMYKLDRRR